MRYTNTTIRHSRRGVTLFEMLAVCLSFGIMMAAATPLYLSAMSDAQAKNCRSNMQAIGNLEHEYRIKSVNHTYTTSIAALKTLATVAVPRCPLGGTYTITISDGTATAQNGQTVPAGNLLISCSASGHGKFAPDVDTN